MSNAAIARALLGALLMLGFISASRAAEVVAFVGVNVVPMDADRVLADQTVVVRDGRIAALGDRGAVVVPRGATRVDGRGRYLLPGLADLHAHVGGYDASASPEASAILRSELLLYVATGVTLIRNMAGGPKHVEYRRRVASGEVLGPRIFTATNVVDGPNAVWSFAIRMSEPAEAEALVEGFVRDGYDQIKVYNELPRAAYAALLDAAARNGIRVVGHVPFSVGIDSALAAGQYSIEHQRGYDFDGVRPQALVRDGGRNAERFGSWTRMSDERMRDLVRKTVAGGTWNTPTFVIDEMLYDAERRQALASHPSARYVHPAVRAVIAKNQLDAIFSAESKAALRESMPAKYRMVKMLDDADAGLLTGTDTMVPYLIPGFTPIDELEHFVRAGMTPYRALRAATINPAQFLGIGSEAGTVAVGKRADLLLVDASPLEDVANLWKRSGVMVAGRWLPEAELRRLLEELAATYPAAARDTPAR
jgi:imidazolonepropionase-like amidohydrolase